MRSWTNTFQCVMRNWKPVCSKQNWIVPTLNLHTNKRHICISVITGIDIKCLKIVNLEALFIPNARIDPVVRTFFSPSIPTDDISKANACVPLKATLAILFLIKKRWNGCRKETHSATRKMPQKIQLSVLYGMRKRQSICARELNIFEKACLLAFESSEKWLIVFP